MDGTLPIVDQHGLAMPLSGLELPQLMGHEHDVASQVRDTNCSAPQRVTQHVLASAPISDDEVDQDDDEDEDEDEAAAAAAAATEGNETGSSGRPGRGVKRKKAGKGGKRTGTPVSGRGTVGVLGVGCVVRLWECATRMVSSHCRLPCML